uniref:C2H2-type domain-containing protein n=1 Tax=Mycena chlorophos TaxID=658473 RepID=A0ABQ0L2R8_MYCCL|nr:predicted protein [Mycena chlorophos]
MLAEARTTATQIGLDGPARDMVRRMIDYYVVQNSAAIAHSLSEADPTRTAVVMLEFDATPFRFRIVNSACTHEGFPVGFMPGMDPTHYFNLHGGRVAIDAAVVSVGSSRLCWVMPRRCMITYYDGKTLVRTLITGVGSKPSPTAERDHARASRQRRSPIASPVGPGVKHVALQAWLLLFPSPDVVMPKDPPLKRNEFKCALCDAKLRNLDEHKIRHDRTCKGLKILRAQLVTEAQELVAPPIPPPGPSSMEVDHAPRPPSPPPEPLTRPSGLPNRRRRVPAKLKDAAPPLPPRIRGKKAVAAPPIPVAETCDPVPEPTRVEWVCTPRNAFGLYKVYPQRPTHDPEESTTLVDLYEAAHAQAPDDVSNDIPLPAEDWYYPFPNPSVAHVMKYHIEEDHPESIAGFDRLIGILQNSEAQDDRVVINDLPLPFSTKKFLDDLDKKGIEPLGVTEAWKEGSVQLSLPCSGRRQKEADAPVVTVEHIYYRPLLDPIREVLQGPLFQKFHTTPFSLRFDPTFDSAELETSLACEARGALNSCGLPELTEGHEDVYGEIYTSRAMLEAYARIPQPPPPQSADDPVDSIIVAMMEWSDATHLAQFGVAQLWPGYTFFGNHPKEFRNKPTSHAGFHQVYFASLPESVRQTYREHYGCDMHDTVFTHLKRDLMHRIWDLLLSDDFLDAYDNGIKIRCFDGLVRLVFPRFFTYSADYPEKVLLATIKSLGGCPCPRCFIAKTQIAETGTVNDMKRRANIRVDDRPRRTAIETVRRKIFESGNAVEGTAVKGVLKGKSWVPIRNAFSKLNTEKTPFNFYSLFVPDLLHEIELGVAKAIIIHLIRMLAAFKNLDMFDQRFCVPYLRVLLALIRVRFREIDPFGPSTIRQFRRVSELKYVAARDYEDCILPVLEGLIPTHQNLVDRLCFELSVWHGMAKLRMHTTTSVRDFRALTKELLTTIRAFSRKTRDVKTYETDREERARKRRDAAMTPTPAGSSGPSDGSSSGGAVGAPCGATGSSVEAVGSSSCAVASSAPLPASRVAVPKSKRASKLEKHFNLTTYKLHSVADYPDTIEHTGTMDSFSTQTGELAHRLVKYFYRRTNRRNHVHQIANQEHRRRLIRAMWQRRVRFKEFRKRTARAAAARARNGGNVEHAGDNAGITDKQRRLKAALRPSSFSMYTPYVPPEQHHFVSHSTKTYCHLSDFPDDESLPPLDSGSDGPSVGETPELGESDRDPALLGVSRKLLSYCRRVLLNQSHDIDDVVFSDLELLNVVIEKGLLYTHALLRVNYTTYDLRREQDTLNLRNRRFFMILSQDPSDPHPYWYGEIVGIFHVNVLLADVAGSQFQRIEFVLVRWLQRDVRYRSGFLHKRLPRVSYIPHHNQEAFGFLDPADILRGAHFIPAFHHGRTKEYLPKSIVRRTSEGDEDWKYYYVNMVVDRDMLMRYRTNVVGHRRAGPPPEPAEAPPADEDRAALEEDAMDVDQPVQQDGSSGEEDEPTDWCGQERGDSDLDPESEDDEELFGVQAIHNRLGFEAH